MSRRQTSNNEQLSLFAEPTDAVEIDNVLTESSDVSIERNDTLGFKILDHWKVHRPKMVQALTKENRLEQAVIAAQELTTDLLHDLAVAKKMDYQMAWEIATREWAFLPDEEDQPQLSFDPATLSPSRHSPATSG